MSSPHVTMRPSGVSACGTLKSPQSMDGAFECSDTTAETASSMSTFFHPLVQPGGMCVVWTLIAQPGASTATERMRSGHGTSCADVRQLRGNRPAMTRPYLLGPLGSQEGEFVKLSTR